MRVPRRRSAVDYKVNYSGTVNNFTGTMIYKNLADGTCTLSGLRAKIDSTSGDPFIITDWNDKNLLY